MKGQKDNRTKWLHVRLTETEYQSISDAFNNTTEGKLSDYARKILLGKPMIKGHRNQSLQDIMAELALLRKDLNGIANNYNQVVKKLHTLPHNASVDQWLTTQNKEAEMMLSSIAAIKNYIAKTAEKWLQE